MYDVNSGELTSYNLGADGTAKLKLPPGEYLVSQFSEFERGEEDWIFFELVAPQVLLEGDSAVVLDARKAKPIVTKAPRAGAEQATSAVGFDRTKPGSNAEYGTLLGGFGNGELFTYSAGPKLPEDQMNGHVASQWGVPGADGFFRNTPYLYALSARQPGEFPTGFNRTVRPRDLAVVDTQVNATTDKQAIAFIFPTMPGVTWAGARAIYLDTPSSLRYYVDAVAADWTIKVEEATSSPFEQPNWELEGPLKHYQAGRTYRERFNAAAFGPRGTANRYKDLVAVSVGNAGDADGALGRVPTETASSVLTRNGEQIGTSDRFGPFRPEGQPAEKAAYKLVTTGTQSATPFATRVDLTATFTSAATTEFTRVPITTVGFRPKVDDRNVTPRTTVTTLPVVVDGAKHLKSLKIEVSGDNGTTWTTAKVTRTASGYNATFTTPAGPTVSLRAHLVDHAGNTTDQSTISAYHLK